MLAKRITAAVLSVLIILGSALILSVSAAGPWGQETVIGNHKFYVNGETGECSAEVINGECWIRESSDGTSSWYCIDNTKGVFSEGSRFWIKWENSSHTAAADSSGEGIWVFRCGVTEPDGTVYSFNTLDGDHGFFDKTVLYTELGEDWDKDDIASSFGSNQLFFNIAEKEINGVMTEFVKIGKNVSTEGAVFSNGNVALIAGCFVFFVGAVIVNVAVIKKRKKKAVNQKNA